MTAWIGDFALESTFDCKFCTVTTTGAPTTLAGGPVISAYVGNSTTQLTAGITLTVDFDAVTGLHNVRVVATAANGYATASNYQLVITTGTVGGTSVVGYVVAQFSIEARSALRPTVVSRTLDVSAGGEAGLDWANIGSPTTAQNLSATNIDVDQVVASVSGAVGSVTGAVGSVTGAVGSVTAAVTVGTINANVITATSINADAITAAKVAADVSAEIADAVWDEDATAHQTGGTFGQAIGDPGADTNTIFKAVVTDATGATVGVDVVALKAETVSIQADTDNIQTRLPAALVGGLMSSDVTAISTDTVAANNAEAFFDGTGYAGTNNVIPLVTTTTTATNVTTVNGLAASVITAASIATDAITAAKIAADAIGASELAADAVTEIAAGVLASTLTETYASVNAAPTLQQALFQIQQMLHDFVISGTTLTVRKLDGTTAMTFTLDSTTVPTTIARTT